MSRVDSTDPPEPIRCPECKASIPGGQQTCDFCDAAVPQEEEGFLLDSVTASQRSVDLSLIQYREGLVDYQRVLDTQRFLTTEQDLWTATRGDVVLNLIAMYKALGGGWQIRTGKEFVPEPIKVEMRNRTNWGNLLAPEELQEPASEEERTKWRWPDW